MYKEVNCTESFPLVRLPWLTTLAYSHCNVVRKSQWDVQFMIGNAQNITN